MGYFLELNTAGEIISQHFCNPKNLDACKDFTTTCHLTCHSKMAEQKQTDGQLKHVYAPLIDLHFV